MDTVLIATLFCVLLATGILFLDGRNRIVLSVLLLLNLAFWYLVVGRGMDILYAENGWMENSFRKAGEGRLECSWRMASE